MAADFKHSKIKDEDSNSVSSTMGTTGTMMAQKRLLGDAGAGATGNGGWYRSNGFWKTFFLYAADRLAATDIATAVVAIDACMELPAAPADVDADVEFATIATLNAAGPVYSTEVPWRYLRARVTTAGAAACQVGLHEQGQG